MTDPRPEPFVTTIHIAGFAARIVMRVASDPAVSWSPRSPRFDVDFDEMQRRRYSQHLAKAIEDSKR